ncbi:MFS transporter, partial [Chloroflexota bacterium]
MPLYFRLKGGLFYGWVVVAASLLIATTIFGTRFSFGVFFKYIESEFNLTRLITSGVTSLHWTLGCIFAILGGWALDKYGPKNLALLMGIFTGLSLLLTSQVNAAWQLFITYSLLLSIGAGALYPVVMATASRWFDKKRGVALGIVGAGSGFGILAMAPLATYLVSDLGWRMAYVVMGFIALLVVIPSSMLLKKSPSDIGAKSDGVKSSSYKVDEDETGKEDKAQVIEFSLLEALKSNNFWSLWFIWLLYSFCYLLILTHIVPHATDIGIPAMEAAVVLSLIGGSNIAGRLLMGTFSDKIGRKRTTIICSLIASGAMILLIASPELWVLYIFGIAFGFSLGGIDPALSALIGDIFGLRNIGKIMGVLESGWAIGAAIGPVIGGLVFDVSGNYFVAFLIGVLAMLIVALL